MSITFADDALTTDSVNINFTDSFVSLNKVDINNLQTDLQKLVTLWKEKNISNSYMLIGKEDFTKSEIFHFQAVPYEPKTSWIGTVWQQLLVLWRFTFGGLSLTPGRVAHLNELYKDLEAPHNRTAAKVDTCANCAFCNKQIIDSQLVFEGKLVRVLYNYAPIGLGGEKLHFLIIPKEHRQDFEALTPEEHQEAFALSGFVISKLKEHFEQIEQPLKKLYIYHKSGKEAGQTVPHWHMHIVLTQNSAQDFWGRLTVLRNILLGTIISFRLSTATLAEQKNKYTQILNPILM